MQVYVLQTADEDEVGMEAEDEDGEENMDRNIVVVSSIP
jgi:hypothetical protein